MKFGMLITCLLLVFSTIALTLPDCAEAARMGGGRSFGGKPYMSTPAPAPMQRRAVPPAGAAAANSAGRNGMFGGMGGLFGGLLAGTLLGSLLGGNGFSGGGFMDLILIAILAFIGFKLFQRFRTRPSPTAAGANPGMPSSGNNFNGGFTGMNRADTGASGWDALRGAGNATAAPVQPAVDVPAGFDTEEFLRGAKMAYNRLQKSWDERDLNDISQFTTPAVMTNLRQQLAEDPTPSRTEILLVNASLLGVETEGQNERAQVYFDVLMRENPNQATPESVREIWHFLRTGNGAWLLDGIQQVD